MKLHIAFSGGKTSAYMTKWLLENKAHEYDDVAVVFANTGQENEKTLQFVDRCDREWNLKTVWVEAVVNPEKGKGTGFKIVDYTTDSRKGEPYEEMIKKYGIPNRAYNHCSRELKLQPSQAYLRSLGWLKGGYHTAIGIRSDEIERISAKTNENFIVYPLIEWHPVTKQDVYEFWDLQGFKLGLKEHEGNCSWCWKKSKRKLLTLAIETPEIFDFPERMERDYGGVNAPDRPRKFFRGNQSTLELFEEAKKPFNKYQDNNYLDDLLGLDEPGGCSESCEPF